MNSTWFWVFLYPTSQVRSSDTEKWIPTTVWFLPPPYCVMNPKLEAHDYGHCQCGQVHSSDCEGCHSLKWSWIFISRGSLSTSIMLREQALFPEAARAPRAPVEVGAVVRFLCLVHREVKVHDDRDLLHINPWKRKDTTGLCSFYLRTQLSKNHIC